MLDPVGYLDIVIYFLEIYALIGLLALFFMERSGYGRASIRRETWGPILVYYVLTSGMYGIYWRLKLSYALSAADRLAPWKWAVLLTGVFVLAMLAPFVLLLLTIWDFVLGNKMSKATGESTSWFLTFLFGHLYLASYVEQHADRLPPDSRVERTGKRPRFLTFFAAFVLLSLGTIGLGYRMLVQHRAEAFARIPGEAVDRTGHWFETHERYDRVYREDKSGHRDVHIHLKGRTSRQEGEWAQYGLNTKIHAGKLYTFNWFSCLEAQKLVESTPTILVLKNARDQSSVDSLVDEDQFSARLQEFQRTSRVTKGWEYGALLRSPWDCELSLIERTWDEAVNTVSKHTWGRLPSFKKP